MANHLSYMNKATNNQEAIVKTHGFHCIYCFGNGHDTDIISWTDESTVICPHCGIDACVPKTDFNKKLLSTWRQQGFGMKYPDTFTPNEIIIFNASINLNAIDDDS